MTDKARGAGDRTLSTEELGVLKESMLPDDDVMIAAEFFKALSDPTRISIVDALQQREWLCVSDLAELLGLTRSAVSHQLGNMRLNKLVRVKRDGKRVFYALDDDHVEQVFKLAVSHIHE
ncbi:MAG: helix-turn-helix transcriptional regulator [Succinivibrio sp.]|nr:helix-turn-helix transcriptional regulator [Succinivibrio sp.]